MYIKFIAYSVKEPIAMPNVPFNLKRKAQLLDIPTTFEEGDTPSRVEILRTQVYDLGQKISRLDRINEGVWSDLKETAENIRYNIMSLQEASNDPVLDNLQKGLADIMEDGLMKLRPVSQPSVPSIPEYSISASFNLAQKHSKTA